MYSTFAGGGSLRLIDRVKTTDRYDIYIMALGGICCCTLFNLLVGQDANWDTRNYHYATVFRLLNRSWDMDIAPSQLQTWFNPIVYIPSYILISKMSPIAASMMLSGLQGLNAPLVYVITRQVLPNLPLVWQRIHAVAAVATAMAGAFFVSEIGTTFIDTLLSLPILGAIILVTGISVRVKSDYSSKKLRGFAAGSLLGLCIGLKLTCLIFAPAFMMATIWYVGRGWMPISFMIGIGMLVGVSVAGGWWFALVWRDFGNPIFPMANGVFHSPWIGTEPIVDARFLPQRAMDLIVYPIRMAVGATSDGPGTERFVGAEVPFRDARYLIGLISSIVLLGWSSINLVRGRWVRDPLLFVAMFWCTSFLAWFYLFGIARYIVVLEMLSGVMVVASLARIMQMANVGRLWMPPVMVSVLILLAFPAKWGHAPFGDSWFGLGDLADLSVPDTTVVLTDGNPVAYVQPFLPESARFVRIAGNFPIRLGYGLGDRAMMMIAEARGPMRSLREAGSQDDPDAMARFGLRVVEGSCKLIPAKAAPLMTCALERVAAR